jgi:hypothetical protein
MAGAYGPPGDRGSGRPGIPASRQAELAAVPDDTPRPALQPAGIGRYRLAGAGKRVLTAMPAARRGAMLGADDPENRRTE